MRWNRIKNWWVWTVVAVSCTGVVYQGCQGEDFISNDLTVLEYDSLSEYKIFRGDPRDLIPNPDYKLYELSAQLFTDYAEKQRLIKVPLGTMLTASDDGLLTFPEGTIIVKTFYYFNDRRDTAKGVRLIETRILRLVNGKWVAGTYVWNESQTEATLISTGTTKTVNWIDDAGVGKVIAYQVPGNLECRTCHNSDKVVRPIGPKVRNLNRNVVRDGKVVNQLVHLHQERVLGETNPENFSTMPSPFDTALPLSDRGRAYLDINCAHCHSATGVAQRQRFRMSYETDLDESKIRNGKNAIEFMMRTGNMPRIGTTVVDDKGLELIREYIDTL